MFQHLDMSARPPRLFGTWLPNAGFGLIMLGIIVGLCALADPARREPSDGLVEILFGTGLALIAANALILRLRYGRLVHD